MLLCVACFRIRLNVDLQIHERMRAFPLISWQNDAENRERDSSSIADTATLCEIAVSSLELQRHQVFSQNQQKNEYLQIK